VLWTFAGPVNKWVTPSIQTEGEPHAPALVVALVGQGPLPVIAWLDPATGRRLQSVPLDNQPNARPPLRPIPLDREGTGKAGFATVMDPGGRKQAASLSLAGGGALAPTPRRAEELEEPRAGPYGLTVAPLCDATGAPQALAWFYGSRYLVLDADDLGKRAELLPSRGTAGRYGGRFPSNPVTPLGTVLGWNLTHPEGVELCLFHPVTLKTRWRREVARETHVAEHAMRIMPLAPGEPERLVVATKRRGLLVLELETGDELARVTDLQGELKDPQPFRRGERRLLALARNTEHETTPWLVLLDPQDDLREVWRYQLTQPRQYCGFHVADLDGDGNDEIVTVQEDDRVAVVAPGLPRPY
jgi:hypothetical protein